MTDFFVDDPFPDEENKFDHIPIESRRLLARKYLDTSEKLLLSLVNPEDKVGLIERLDQIRQLAEDQDASLFLSEEEEAVQVIISELRKTELFHDQPEHELSVLATQLQEMFPPVGEPFFQPFEDKNGVYIIDGKTVICGMDCFTLRDSQLEEDEIPKCVAGDEIDRISVGLTAKSRIFYIKGDSFVDLISLLPSCAQSIIQCVMGELRETMDFLRKERVSTMEQLRLTRDMLENMGIGLLCINQAGEIGQFYNALVEDYLDRKSLAGVPFADMIFGKDRDALRNYYRALQMLFSGNLFDPEMIISMLPNEVTINERIIKLDYFFVQDRQGHVQSLFVRLEDLTSERFIAKKEEQEKRIIDAMHANIGGYFQMLEDIEAALGQAQSFFDRFSSGQAKGEEENVAGLMRSLHSAKGLCGQYELEQLKSEIHKTESFVQNVLNEEIDVDAFKQMLKSFKKEFQYAVSIKDSLGKEIIRILQGINYSQDEFDQLFNAVNAEEHDTVRLLVQEKTMVSAERIVDNWSKDISSLADNLEKKIDFQADIPDDLKINKNLAHRLNVEMGHLYRNSVDHGIEFPAERKKAGKHETGIISIKVWEESKILKLVIRDDGGGLDNSRIILAAKENPALDQQEVEKLISSQEIWKILFLKGFSSRKSVTQISGRGVGLDSVKETLDEIGGTIRMTSETGKGSTFSVNIPINTN